MSELAEHLTSLIEAEKIIAGTPAWEPGPRPGQMRWLASLQTGGEVLPLSMVIDCFPRSELLRFSISLICGAALVRLDYWHLDRHLNHRISGVPTPATVELGWLDGHHLHGWPENRILVKNEPPKELEFAIPLPLNIQGFSNCFRWFASEHRIALGGGNYPPDLPPRDTLL